MPVMPGKYPPPTKQQQTEVIFEHNVIEPPAEEDLVVLEPAAVNTRRGKSERPSAAADAPVDPYNLDNYLLTSAEGFSPFEQNLGKAPFKDLRGDDIWPALAYTEDGGVHPGKAAPHLNPPIRVPLGGKEFHLPAYSAYSILLFNPDYMEYVALDEDDKVPEGHTPVPAGCERDGLQKLYFASAMVHKTFLDSILSTEKLIEVPGKWGEHLGGVMVAYDEKEILIKRGGKVLCWKKH